MPPKESGSRRQREIQDGNENVPSKPKSSINKKYKNVVTHHQLKEFSTNDKFLTNQQPLFFNISSEPSCNVFPSNPRPNQSAPKKSKLSCFSTDSIIITSEISTFTFYASCNCAGEVTVHKQQQRQQQENGEFHVQESKSIYFGAKDNMIRAVKFSPPQHGDQSSSTKSFFVYAVAVDGELGAGEVKLLNLESGEFTFELTSAQSVTLMSEAVKVKGKPAALMMRTLAVSPDGRRLVTSGDFLFDLKVWSIEGELDAKRPRFLRSLQFPPILVERSAKDREDRIDVLRRMLQVDPNSAIPPQLMDEGEAAAGKVAYAVRFSPDSKTLIATGSPSMLHSWDVETGATNRPSIEFFPDETFFLKLEMDTSRSEICRRAECSDEEIATSRRIAEEHSVHLNFCMTRSSDFAFVSMSVTSCQRYLILGGWTPNRSIQIVDLVSWKLLDLEKIFSSETTSFHTLPHGNCMSNFAVGSVACLPGKTAAIVATASYNDTVKFWSLEAGGQCVATLTFEKDSGPMHIDFSKDGNWFFVCLLKQAETLAFAIQSS